MTVELARIHPELDERERCPTCHRIAFVTFVDFEDEAMIIGTCNRCKMSWQFDDEGETTGAEP